MTLLSNAQARSQRLDALTFNRLHGRLVWGSGLGWAMDAMDVGLISFILVALPESWAVSSADKSWIAAAGFSGMAIGASLGGLIADRLGRRQVFALTLLVYGLATGASALAWGVGALIALRFVVGLGLGAELPVASTLVSEFSPPRIRGRVIVWLEAFWALGWTAAALIGYYVASPTGVFGAAGWRVALLIGAVPAAYAVFVRRSLPESVRFLQSKGRFDEAEAAVQAFERASTLSSRTMPTTQSPTPPAARSATSTSRSATRDLGPTMSAPEATTPASGPPAGRAAQRGAAGPGETDRTASADGDTASEFTPVRARVSALFTGGMAARTRAIWTVWFCVNFAYYGAFTWLPTLLTADGASVTKSLGYTLIITLAQLPGYACAAWLIELWGRRVTLTVFLAGAAGAAGLFALASGPGQIIAAGMALSFFNLGAWGALYAITPEIYPTTLRGTGAGWAAGFGRLASIVTALATMPLHARLGTGPVFAIFGTCFLIAAAAAWALPEMRGRQLAEA
ncbi:MAG: MFS transporter [Bifidobacteriaceae bacterium]|jgi:putative MFS transporter|nr:MFS transporter [Bifidobacteriaceae bacterium]